MPRPRLHLIRFHGVLVPNAKLRALMMSQVPELAAQAPPPADSETRCAQHPPVRLRWARLLARVFALDLGHCPNCDGELKIIAAILEQPMIDKILMRLGLQADGGRSSAHARRPSEPGLTGPTALSSQEKGL